MNKIAATAPCALYLLVALTMPESPRWLLLHDRKEDAQKVMDKMARGNKEPSVDVHSIYVQKETHHRSMLDLFASRTMTMKTLIITSGWFVATLMYYGLTYDTNVAFEDIYLTTLVIGLAEAPGYLLAYVSGQYIGRRWTISGSMFIGAVFMIILPFVGKETVWLRPAIAMLGKVFATIIFSVVIVYTTEIFPTGLRSSATNWSNSWGRIAGILAPLVIKLRSWYFALPAIVFVVMAMVGGALNLLLPESQGYPMPGTIEEADRMLRGREKAYMAEILSARSKNPHDDYEEEMEEEEEKEKEKEAIMVADVKV